jgi:hypothetical protein
MPTEELSLDKFGSIGGSYFEVLIALALDDLGYVEGETYLASWAKKCVPGTWIEADFIISAKKDRSKDPLNNGRIVFAVGHATSENSAGMKFHRDVEQLLEVKALPNGDDYRVADILFCCPRETMGGWSKELVAINEAIFDDHLIVWKHDWGRRLLYCIQQSAAKVTEGTPEAKKERLRSLITASPAFTRSFGEFRSHLSTMLARKTSASKIENMFVAERKERSRRLARDLLIREPRETDFKRGLLQVLALNDWELRILWENHRTNRSQRLSLEADFLQRGMSQKEFDAWWRRLDLLSVRLGVTKREVETPGTELTEDEVRWFEASEELRFAFDSFSIEQLLTISRSFQNVAPNLVPYVNDLRDLSRFETWLNKLPTVVRGPDDEVHSALTDSSRGGLGYVRLPLFECGMAVLSTKDSRFSYDKLAKATGHPGLIRQSDHARFFAAGQRSKIDEKARALTCTLAGMLRNLRAVDYDFRSCCQKFIDRRLDGMIKQHREGVLDVLIEEEIRSFVRDIGGTLSGKASITSVFSEFSGGPAAGVNVEVPYVINLKGGGSIYIHRVMSDGGVGHKRKEFSSKVRSIRYASTPDGKIRRRPSLLATILIIDGNWVTPDLDDQLTAIRMLTVAGWDHVVFPDQLAAALTRVKSDLKLEATAPVAGKVVA